MYGMYGNGVGPACLSSTGVRAVYGRALFVRCDLRKLCTGEAVGPGLGRPARIPDEPPARPARTSPDTALMLVTHRFRDLLRTRPYITPYRTPALHSWSASTARNACPHTD